MLVTCRTHVVHYLSFGTTTTLLTRTYDKSLIFLSYKAVPGLSAAEEGSYLWTSPTKAAPIVRMDAWGSDSLRVSIVPSGPIVDLPPVQVSPPPPQTDRKAIQYKIDVRLLGIVTRPSSRKYQSSSVRTPPFRRDTRRSPPPPPQRATKHSVGRKG